MRKERTLTIINCLGQQTANSGTIVIRHICWRKPVFSAMTWAKRLKRGLDINIETCKKCSGDVRIIASIEDPMVIGKILSHLNDSATSVAIALLPESRLPHSTSETIRNELTKVLT